MKTRADFVSNSSSSSFVMSIDFNQYPFDAFVKTVCKECDNSEDDVDMMRANDAMLRYCLTFNELLFLGVLKLGKEKHTYKCGFYYDGKQVESDDMLYCTPFEHWSNALRDAQSSKSSKDYVFENEVKLIDADTIETNEPIEITNRIVVTRGFMSNHFGGWFGHNTEDKERELVERIIRFAKQFDDTNAYDQPENYATDYDSIYAAETYLITQHTIDNTRALLKQGVDVSLDKWEDLDELEARLKSGQTIFHTCVGDSGEGGGDFRLFTYGSQYPFNKVPVETISNEW